MACQSPLSSALSLSIAEAVRREAQGALNGSAFSCSTSFEAFLYATEKGRKDQSIRFNDRDTDLYWPLSQNESLLCPQELSRMLEFRAFTTDGILDEASLQSSTRATEKDSAAEQIHPLIALVVSPWQSVSVSSRLDRLLALLNATFESDQETEARHCLFQSGDIESSTEYYSLILRGQLSAYFSGNESSLDLRCESISACRLSSENEGEIEPSLQGERAALADATEEVDGKEGSSFGQPLSSICQASLCPMVVEAFPGLRLQPAKAGAEHLNVMRTTSSLEELCHSEHVTGSNSSNGQEVVELTSLSYYYFLPQMLIGVPFFLLYTLGIPIAFILLIRRVSWIAGDANAVQARFHD